MYEFHILPNRIIGAAKDHGENYIKVRPLLVCHLYRNRSILLFVLSNVDGNSPNILIFSYVTQFTVFIGTLEQMFEVSFIIICK